MVMSSATPILGVSHDAGVVKQHCADVLPLHPTHGPLSSLSQAGPNLRQIRPAAVWRESLAVVERYVPFNRRKVHSGERLYLCGDPFETLYVVHAGLCQTVNLAPDGREQPAGLSFKGDWIGFDGIPTGQHGCSAIALDCGELWAIRYANLLRAGADEPRVLRMLLSAMSSQLALNRDAMLTMGTLPADARVADFLLQWAQALEERGLRNDQINVHMTRADMGNYLGLTLESVSRALSRLARCGVIRFNEKGRREISIPDVAALSAFIQDCADPGRRVFH